MGYLRRKGTEADPASVRQRVSAAFQAIEEVLGEIDEATARQRPAEGKWCVQEIVDHLVESHRPAVDQLAALLAGRPPGEAIPAGLQSADPLVHDWETLVAALRKVQSDFLGVLAHGTAATSTDARAQVVFVVKVREGDGSPQPREWIEELDWKAFAVGVGAHTREHQDQIRRTLAAVRR